MKLFQQSLPFVIVLAVVGIAALGLMSIQSDNNTLLLKANTTVFCRQWIAKDCDTWPDDAIDEFGDVLESCFDKHQPETAAAFGCVLDEAID
jgi:hypothetical protein